MTNLQMQYANVLENKQHNRNVENEAQRHNLEQERLQGEQNAETRRYNEVLEQLKREDIATDRYKALVSDVSSQRSYVTQKEANAIQSLHNQRADKLANTVAKYDSWAKVVNAQVNKKQLNVSEFVARTNAYFKEVENDIKWFEANVKDKQVSAEIRNMNREMLIRWQKLQPELDKIDAEIKMNKSKSTSYDARAIKDIVTAVTDLGGIASKIAAAMG